MAIWKLTSKEIENFERTETFYYHLLIYMATLATLIGQNGPLTDVRVPLARFEVSRRSFYAFRELIDWIASDLPVLEQGRLNASDTPKEQLDQLLYKWISGRPIVYNRMFKDLMPMQDEVWEMKTPDLRIFGWMCEPRKFIAVFADYADNYKGRTPKASYQSAKTRVKKARNSLDLDEPKIAIGDFDALVCV